MAKRKIKQQQEQPASSPLIDMMLENINANKDDPDAYDDWKESIETVDPLIDAGPPPPPLNDDGSLADGDGGDYDSEND